MIICVGAVIALLLFFCYQLVYVGIGIIVLAIVASFFPFEGFKTPNCEVEIKIIPLRSLSKQREYIRRYHDKVTFAYDNRKKYKIDGELYEEGCVRGKIKIYESEDCQIPILKVFKTKPIRGFCIAPFSTKTEYIFYIPLDTKKNNDKEKEQNPKSDINIEVVA